MIRNICIFIGLLIPSLGLAQDSTRVLFIGNSFTYTNNMPQLFTGFANASAHPVITAMHAPAGVSVGDTLQDTMAHMKNPTLYKLIASTQWDFVVIQDNQGRFVLDSAVFPASSLVVKGHRQLMDSVKAHSPCAKIILFAGWGVKNGQPPYGNTGTEMIQRILRNYVVLNSSMKEVIAPIGEAWISGISRLPATDLWSPDQAHPSLAGSYLTAAVIFSTMFNQSPANIAFAGGLSTDIADSLKKFAAETISLPYFHIRYNLGGIKSPVITQNGNTLSVAGNYSNYQWFLNNAPINGANTSSLLASGSGNYSVLLKDSTGCWLKSCAMPVLVSGTLQTLTGPAIRLYPNPSADRIKIETETQIVGIEITDMCGHLLQNISNITNREVDISLLKPGCYWMHIHSAETGVMIFRFIRK